MRAKRLIGPLARTWQATVLMVAGMLACPLQSPVAKAGTAGAAETRGTVLANVPVEMPRAHATDAVSVYWVGHSLIETKVEIAGRSVSLMTLLDEFARHQGLAYRMGDHTLYGAPLSLLWRGVPHSYARDAGLMAWKRTVFEAEAAKYDTLVLTEALPVAATARHEHSAYHMQQFFCALRSKNNLGRVYLFESWVHLHATDPRGDYGPLSAFRWRNAMLATRRVWDELAQAAVGKAILGPRLRHRLRAGLLGVRTPCALDVPIYTVPVGAALVALLDRMISPARGDDFHLPSGGKLTMTDLFANPYRDWRNQWLVDGSGLSELDKRVDQSRLRDPSKPIDDIHPSATGVYFNALVHFATLYRRSPVGLPALPEVGRGVSRTLQCIAWETVLRDPRSGVAAPMHREQGC